MDEFMVEFEKALNSVATNSATFDVDAVIDKVVDKNIDVDQDVDLTGNFANLFGDVEAVGSNTLSDAEFSILTIENELSSIAVLAESASQNGDNGDEPTRIGADIDGSGEYLTGSVNGFDFSVPNGTTNPEPEAIRYSHNDFDDRNGALDLDLTGDGSSFSLLPPGPPPPADVLNPGFSENSGNPAFDTIDLILAEDGDPVNGIQYVSDRDFDGDDSTFTRYNFGEITADVDTTGDGFCDTTITDDLIIQIPDGTIFTLQFVGDDPQLTTTDIGPNGAPTLLFGDEAGAVGDLGAGLWSTLGVGEGSFAYDNQFDPSTGLGEYGVVFSTAFEVVCNFQSV